jgi:uncharacterized phage-associated protein
MAGIVFQFNRAKAVETVLYLAQRVSDHDVYGLCKLLYLVDKTSLERYGRFLFGESYSAMKQGATPSNTYDLLKQARVKPINGVRVEGDTIIPERDSDLDYLSESDIECLDDIISRFGEASYIDRRMQAHDEAYHAAWSKRGKKGSVRIPVESIAGLFDGADDLIDYLSNRNAD